MSYCRREGKDIIIFATKEDHAVPSTVKLPEIEPSPGLINLDGSINWNCPCLGGMATGPCGVEFRDAFSCFHYSKEEPKGSECFEAFRTMQNCMEKYPNVYNRPSRDEDDDEDDEDLGLSNIDKEKDVKDLPKSVENNKSSSSIENKK